MSTDTPSGEEQTPSEPRRRGRPRRSDSNFTPRDRSPSSTRSRSSSTRSTRQRVDPNATPASVYGGSIRDSARIRSIATGSQQSVSSAASTYNIQYFHQRNSSGPNAGNPAAGGTAQDRDIFMQANLPSQQATSPIQATRLHNTNTPATMANPRTCICLDKTFPKNCTECSSSTGMPCPKHSLIKCSNEACTKQFHKACIASLQYIDIHDEVALSGYTCMECSCRKQLEEDGMDVPFSELEGTAGHKEKLLRLGLFPIEPRAQPPTNIEIVLEIQHL
jgi:hypothetical protein